MSVGGRGACTSGTRLKIAMAWYMWHAWQQEASCMDGTGEGVGEGVRKSDCGALRGVVWCGVVWCGVV